MIICGQYRATHLQLVGSTIHSNVAISMHILGNVVMAKAHAVLLRRVLVVPPHLHHMVIPLTLANAVKNSFRTSHVKPAAALDTVLSTVCDMLATALCLGRYMKGHLSNAARDLIESNWVNQWKDRLENSCCKFRQVMHTYLDVLDMSEDVLDVQFDWACWDFFD
jgi:hypothetical protein